MDEIEWFNVIDKSSKNIDVIIQEGYIKTLGKKDLDTEAKWLKANLFKANFRVKIRKKPLYFSHYFSEILFNHKDIFYNKLKMWIKNIKSYMSRVLTIADFTWIIINEEKYSGYYSFKENGYEICIDYSYRYGWLVSLCNRFEEVINAYYCCNECQSLKMANEIYKSFVGCAMI